MDATLTLADHIRYGNSKLPKTTAIFNICSATDCPSVKLGLCQAYKNGKCICYALKAEMQYHHVVLPFRRRQEKVWDSLSGEDFAWEFITIIDRRRTATTALRLNESGDFRSQADVNKASEIARVLSHRGIVVYGYTARKDLDFSNVHPNLVINGSGFKVHGEFRMVMSKADKPEGYGMCCGDCRKCKRCLKGMLTCNLPH
jgi:hypothetical protein